MTITAHFDTAFTQLALKAANVIKQYTSLMSVFNLLRWAGLILTQRDNKRLALSQQAFYFPELSFNLRACSTSTPAQIRLAVCQLMNVPLL